MAGSTNHGAKNSTKINGSGLTTDSKLAAVRLMTSEAPSATATVTKANKAAAGDKIIEGRIGGREEKVDSGYVSPRQFRL
jgi:hypothetical protein